MTWRSYSYETSEQIVLISLPLKINRQRKDGSILAYSIETNGQTEFMDGDSLSLIASIDSRSGSSAANANAYNVELYLYYDTRFLSITSINSIEKNLFSISPTRNTTRPGFVHFSTDSLSILNNHFIEFNFKFNFPKEIFTGNNLEGAIVIDFQYHTNLAKFHGTVNTTNLGRLVSYKCKINKARRTEEKKSARITVPGFSVLYDDVNMNIYVCQMRSKYSYRTAPCCHVRKNGQVSWSSLASMASIASIVGIDTNKNELYGLDSQGKGYIKSMHDFSSFTQVLDNDWASIQNQPHVRKAKTISDVALLPSTPSVAWIFPPSGNQLWAATNTGLMCKISGQWETVYKLG